MKAKKNGKKAKRASDLEITGGTLLPESWKKYSRTFLCTHAMTFDSKSTEQSDHTNVRSTVCTARVNARVRLRTYGNGFHMIVNEHNRSSRPNSE